MDKETQDKIKQLETVEQNLQAYGVQRQAISSQLVEVESALKEVGKSDEAYRIVGNVMVKADKAKLVEELTEKAETLKKRLDTVEKQESRLREEAGRIQKEVMKDMD